MAERAERSRRPAYALIAGAVVAVGTLVGYRRRVKPWQQRWGATDDEVAAALPGDACVREPADQVTRAISIEATPEQIWPWLVQIGADRGGFYSYDWAEDAFGLGIHSADEIVEEWQNLAVGDVVHANASRAGGTAGGWYVMDVSPNERLVLKTADLKRGRPVDRNDPAGWEFGWTFALRPDSPGSTRLLVRERVAFGSRLMRCLMAPVGLISFVMTRKMMLGLKERAERHRP